MLDEKEAKEKLRELFATDDVVKVHQALSAGSDSEVLRIVGGTMRDLLLAPDKVRDPSQDLDFATPLRPDKVEQLLNEAGIKTIRKGRSFEHGTVIAVLPRSESSGDYRQFEITSLRRDIKTDGRHAEVDFTEDWQEDSNRRDFSINALYGDSKGTIHDYHNGLGDLEERVVRFIGNREERIEEDALRILRFFRFSALVGETGYIDPNRWCMRAIQSKAHLIDRLSGERVWAELKKILSISDNQIRNQILQAMKAMGVLSAIHPSISEIEVEWLLNKQKLAEPFDALVHLTALLAQGDGVIQEVAERLRLTHEELNSFKILNEPLLSVNVTDVDLPKESKEKLEATRRALDLWRASQKYNKKVVRARLCITAARDNRNNKALSLDLTEYYRGKISFHITGDDVMRELEISPSPQVGEILQAVEDWWLLGKREAGREACLEYLRKEFGEK